MKNNFTLNPDDYHSLVLQLLIENKAMILSLREIVESDICSRKPESCNKIRKVSDGLYAIQIAKQVAALEALDTDLGDWIKDQLGL